MSDQRYSRRELIKASASLSSATLASPYAFSASKKKLGIALVGLGYYSRDLLAPALQLTQHCELKGIVTGSPEKIPVWQKKYGIKDKNVYNYKNMHQIANNPDIDVIYIVTPTGLHKEHSLIAAAAGKHVWCEKPMAMNVGECEEIMSACKKSKLHLSIGYRLHHEPNTQSVMGFNRTKPYGDIQNLISEAGYEGSAPEAGNWRLKKAMGGGALYDMGVYPINAARFATGMEPIAVSAQHETTRPKVFTEVDETTLFTLYFKGGITAQCATSVGKNMNTLRVNCKKGWYELKPMQYYNGVKGETSDGKKLNKTIANQQAAQMDNEALSIINSKGPKVPGEQGLMDIAVVEAALKSAANNGKRIEI